MNRLLFTFLLVLIETLAELGIVKLDEPVVDKVQPLLGSCEACVGSCPETGPRAEAPLPPMRPPSYTKAALGASMHSGGNAYCMGRHFNIE